MAAKVSLAVMAHPARRHLVADLVAKLDVDPAIAWDDGSNDRIATGLRALEAFNPSVDMHAVLQDDAVPCRDLAAGVAKLTEHVPPDSPIGLYFGSGVPRRGEYAALYRRAKTRGHRWVMMQRVLLWGVAIAIPTAHLEPLIAYYQSLRSASYDGRVSAYFNRAAKVEAWYPVPSLVEHRADVPSLVSRSGGGRYPRVAHEWIGADRSPLDVDWDTGVTR